MKNVLQKNDVMPKENRKIYTGRSLKRCAGMLLVFVVMFVSLGLLSGCSDDNADNGSGNGKVEKAAKVEKDKLEADSVVVAVGDETATYQELLVYMYILKDRYQDTFGDDIWTYQLDNGKTFKQITMEQVISLIAELKIIGSKAEGLGITLSSDEQEDIRQFVKEMYTSVTVQDKEEYLLDEEVMTQIYCENEIADRVYDSFISGVNTAISEEDYRQCSVWYIYLQTSGENQSGVTVTLSQDEIAKRYKEARKLRKRAVAASDFLSFAEANTEAASAQLIFGKGDMSDEFTQAAFALKKGEISDVVTAPEGYYIIYCVNENDAELSAAKKEELISAAQKENFEASYSKWAAGFEVEVSELIMK